MALFHTTVLDNQIKALPTVDTASGSVATFDTDMTENLVEVKCQIVAQQSGSGTPSPDNVRPITTYSEMNVFATDKNLSEVSDTYKFVAQSCTYIYENNGVNITATNVFARIGFSYKVKTGQKYTISYYAYGTGDYITVYYNDANSWQYSYGTQKTTATRTKYTKTITATSDVLFIGFYATANNTSGDMIIEDFMVELGEEATSFVAYNGTTANIPFGQTIYGGSLNVGSGVLTVTHKAYDLSTLSWNSIMFGSSPCWQSASQITDIKMFADNVTPTNTLCEQYALLSVDSLYSGNGGLSLRNSNSRIYAYQYDSQTEPQGLLVAELLTPTTIQLDSITLQALLNENNIWCDTGDTEVKYLLTVGKKIA